MRTRNTRRTAFALGCIVILAGATALRAAQEPGELWETSTRMTMSGEGGMALPAQTMKTCRPKGEAWNEPPGGPKDSKCEMTDVNRTASKMTWKVRCSEPPASGSGTIEFKADSYSGTMNLAMDQGEFAIKLSGKRVGECDFADTRKQVDDMQRMAAAGQAQHAQIMGTMCSESARAGMTYLFIGPNAQCKEPAQKAEFCAGLATETGYEGALAGASLGVDINQAAAACGKDPEAIRSELCVKAYTAESLEFLVKRCPEQSKMLAQRECAGRKYTSLQGSKYFSFCGAYAQAEMQAAEQPPAQDSSGKKTMDKAKKGLKSIFGR